MRSMNEFVGTDLLWDQPARTKRAFELRAAQELVGGLRFQRGSLADAEAADGRWTFKREGFWHPRVTVRVAGSDTDVAVFHASWRGGGTLELVAGTVVRLATANMWQSEWVWQAGDEPPLVRFKARQGFLTSSARVAIAAEAVARDDLSLLGLLGWYLILLYAEDAIVASSAATAVVTG